MSTRKVKCYAPFYNVYLRASSRESRVCCTANGHHPIKSNEISEIFNNDLAREMREYMLRDEYHPGCHECKKREDLGLHNDRDMYDTWYRNSSVDLPEPQLDMTEPYWADIRPSNLCNLKCRMCYPDNSTEVAREYADLGWPVDSVLKQRKHHELPTLPKVLNLKLLGGEPTLQTEIETQLKQLVKQEHSYLNITTNASSITQFKQWETLFKSIAQVSFNISIDGTGEYYEYIRTPARWDRFKDAVNYLNNNQLAKYNTLIGFNFCLQAWNFTNYFDTIQYVEQFNPQSITVNMVDQPWLSLAVIPVAYRKTWFEGLSSVEKKVLERRRALKKWSDHTPFDPLQVPKFIQYSSTIDSHRGTDYSKINPELWESVVNSI